jgi:hypothetical protein
VIRKLTAVALALGALVLTPGAVSADERAPARKPTVTLSLDATGMAEVRQPFRLAVTPAPKDREVVAALQVQSSTGYVTQQRVSLDSRGRATGVVVSNRAAVRTYRAVLLSERGRVIAASAPVTVTWAPLTYTPTLACSLTSAQVDVDIPCTITVTPAVKLDGVLASLEVMTVSGWLPLEAIDVPAKGTIQTHVAGIEPGVGTYRVVLLRDAKVLAISPTISITYSATNSAP